MSPRKNKASRKLIALTDSGLDIYLRQIAKTKPLTAQEECELAARIQGGDDSALDTLILANLRFVISVARAYENQGLPIADLINIGNLGLIKAARKFDGKKNFKFISYAVWWIRQAILVELANQSRLVRLPVNQAGLVYKVEQARQKLLQRSYGEATAHDIAGEIDVSVDEVRHVLQVTSRPTSLDAPSEDGKSTLYDRIPGEGVSQDEVMAEISLTREVERTLAFLDERERDIITLYFGIGEESNYTLDEIGHRLKLTRERVRQIKEKALKKLQKPALSGKLRDFHWPGEAERFRISA